MSLISTQANAGPAARNRSVQSGTLVRTAVLPVEWRGEVAPRNGRTISLKVMVAACWSRIRRAQARRRAIEELRDMDDRALRDIGISRWDIAYIVRYGVRRE